MNKNITFLILHYCSINDTIECIKSIQNLKTKHNIELVVVDNGSYNNTGQQLEKMFSDNKNIHIILSEKNLGFARGNNLGFVYAKNNMKSDFIVMINNDVIIDDENFCEKIVDLYNKENFDVLGPKIVLSDGNEYFYQGKMVTYWKELITIIKIIIRLISNYLFIYEILKKIKNTFRKKAKKEKYDVDKVNVFDKVLHGCCLIFSSNYIDLFDGIDDRTFLYCEEELLYLRLKKHNMHSLYNRKISIIHNEDRATNYVYKNQRKKNIFKDKQLLKSSIILLKELKTQRGKNEKD